jgi:hypothetical protein
MKQVLYYEPIDFGATLQNLFSMTSQCLVFVHPCLRRPFAADYYFLSASCLNPTSDVCEPRCVHSLQTTYRTSGILN